MDSLYKKESLILLLGDLVSFFLSLWVALFLRNLEAPSGKIFYQHLGPFLILFTAWFVVFYIAGLYEKHTTILRSRLPHILANTQLVNSGIAVAFFYLIPFFGITPKIVLFIYLFVSLVLILAWRMYGYFLMGRGRYNTALLIGSGDEMKELYEEVNNNPIYNIHFISSVDLSRSDEQGFLDEIIDRVYSEGVSVIAIDLAHENVEPVLPHLYNLIFSKISFVDMNKIYEDIFDRVPISLLKYNWFLENISTEPRGVYDTLKRVMDIIIALPLFLFSLILFPFIAVAIKFDTPLGSIFTHQNRVGQNNKPIRLLKFRTMLFNDDGDWKSRGVENQVTKVGSFLRKTRLDEFPQLWNVLKGDISLIGPRPEFPEAVKHYMEDVPYYNVRHLVRPGLSGWAQIYGDHPHHGVDISKTKNKLSYDLYYIKNRSFLLDLKIALKTVRTLASIAGR